MQHTVAGAHAARLDALDSGVHQRSIRVLDCAVIIGRVDQPLAGRTVIRAQPLAQLRIAHAVLEVGKHDRLDLGHAGGVGVDDGVGEALHIGEIFRLVLHPVQQGRIAAKRRFLLLGEGRVFHRHDPLRGALEVAQLAGARRECGDNLHAGRAGADDADAFAVECHGMIPARTVEAGTLEGIEAGNGRLVRVVQDPGGGDHDIGRIAQPAFHLELPASIVEFATDDFLVEADQLLHTVLLHGAFEVLLDFGAGRQHVAPVRVWLERIGIGVRGHIAGESRIGVFAPGAADPGGFLIDRAVRDAGFEQLDAAQDA